MKQRSNKRGMSSCLMACVLLASAELAQATEFEKLGDAIAGALGTSQAFSRKLGSATVFFSKDAKGQPARYAFVEKGLYEPSCTHTWVIGVDAKTSAVSAVRVVEMSCPHAFPTRAASFLDQFLGKGPKDVATLDASIDTIAKATGSSKLTTAAVIRVLKKVPRGS